MSFSKRAVAAPIVTAATVAALVFGSGAMTAYADGPTVTASFDQPVITLPIGDGFQDTSNLSIASSGSDYATVSFTNLNNDGDVPADADVPLTDDGSGTNFVGSIDLGSLGFDAGYYSISVDEDGTVYDVPDTFTVGSGAVDSITVTPSATDLYTNGSAAEDSLTATVTAVDETGTQLPISGYFTFADASGNETSDNLTPESGTVLNVPAIDVTGDASGTATLDASVAGPADNDDVAAPTTDITLSKKQALLGVNIAASASSVYPVKDGYRDTVGFTVTPVKLDQPSELDYTGSVTISSGAKIVKVLPFSGSTSSKVTWDGLVDGKVVAGTYNVVASLTSLGTTVTKATTEVVSAARLHAHTTSVTQNANAFFSNAHREFNDTKSTGAFSINSRTASASTGSCSLHSTKLYCASTGKEGMGYRLGFMSTPAAVRKSAAYKPFVANFSYVVTETKRSSGGTINYIWGGPEQAISSGTITKSGTKTTRNGSFGPSNASEIIGVIYTFGNASVHVSKVKVSFEYYTLS